MREELDYIRLEHQAFDRICQGITRHSRFSDPSPSKLVDWPEDTATHAFLRDMRVKWKESFGRHRAV